MTSCDRFGDPGEKLVPKAPSVPHTPPPGTDTVAPSASLAAEKLVAAKSYYASRIAAARLSLSHTELTLAINTSKIGKPFGSAPSFNTPGEVFSKEKEKFRRRSRSARRSNRCSDTRVRVRNQSLLKIRSIKADMPYTSTSSIEPLPEAVCHPLLPAQVNNVIA